jgi:hypothetical protein
MKLFLSILLLALVIGCGNNSKSPSKDNPENTNPPANQGRENGGKSGEEGGQTTGDGTGAGTNGGESQCEIKFNESDSLKQIAIKSNLMRVKCGTIEDDGV